MCLCTWGVRRRVFRPWTPEQGTASWTRWRCCRRAKAIPVLLGVPNWDCTVPPSYYRTGSSARPRTGTASLLVSEYYRTFADMCNAIITYYRTVRFKLDIVRYASRNPKLFCTKLMIGAIDTPVCSKNLSFEGFFSKFGRRPARPFLHGQSELCRAISYERTVGAKAVRSPRTHNLTSRRIP